MKRLYTIYKIWSNYFFLLKYDANRTFSYYGIRYNSQNNSVSLDAYQEESLNNKEVSVDIPKQFLKIIFQHIFKEIRI
jgi:hypothetical protein